MHHLDAEVPDIAIIHQEEEAKVPTITSTVQYRAAKYPASPVSASTRRRKTQYHQYSPVSGGETASPFPQVQFYFFPKIWRDLQ